MPEAPPPGHTRRPRDAGGHLLDGTIHVLMAQALLPLTALFTAGYLSRKLEPTGYGLLTLTASLVLWFHWAVAALFSRATVKLVSDSEDVQPAASATLRLYLIASCTALVVLWLLAPSIAAWLEEPRLAWTLQLYAFDLPLVGFASAHRNILIGTGRYRARAGATAVRWLARLGLVVLLVGLGLSVAGAILAGLGASLCECIVMRLYVQPGLLRAARFPRRALWNLAAPLFVSSLGLRLLKLDLVALKALGGTTAEVGLYGAARNLAGIPLLLGVALAPHLLATMSRLRQDGEQEEASRLARQTLQALLMLLPLAALGSASGVEVALLIYGPKFATAGLWLSLLLFGSLALVWVQICCSMLVAVGRPALTLAVTLPMVPLILVGYRWLIPIHGGWGAALVTSGAAVCSALFGSLAVVRILGVLPGLRSLACCTLLTALGGALGHYLPASGVLLVLKLLGGSALLVACLWLLGELRTETWRRLMKRA